MGLPQYIAGTVGHAGTLGRDRSNGRCPKPYELGLGVRTIKGIVRSVFHAMSASCG